MSTNGIIKIILGILLLLAFIPSGYLGLDGTLQTVLVILLAILGVKLILDGINQL
jgi:predicted phage tail protein